MTNRTLSKRGLRFAVLAAALTTLLGAMPVHAASAVEIEARALVAGHFEVGGWMAVSVTLVNDGEPTDGYVTARTEVGAVRKFVEMPAGARKSVMLYVQPEAFQRQLSVSYDEPNGSATTTVDVQVFEQSDDQVAIVGDGTGALRPQLLGSGDFASVEPIAMAPADVPERPEPLDGLSAIVWAGDSAGLGEAQRRALERWVSEGGQLVIIGGPDWQARTSAFSDILPLEGLAAVDGVEQTALAAWSGESEAAVESATVSTGSLRTGGRELVTADGGEILASMRPLGAGRVILIGSDLATAEYRGWEGAPRLWGRLLPTNAIFEQFGGGFPIDQQMDSTMSSALATLPTLDVPPAELLLVIIVGYILLIGPISYIFLRRIDRRELAWVTAPILIVLFSACSYGVGRTLKGGDVVVNQITLIRTAAEGGSASVDTYAGIFSPDRSTYDLSVDADALLGRLARLDGLAVTPVEVEQGQPARMRDLAIGVFGFEGVRAAGVVEHEPSLSVTWSTNEQDNVVGTVTNTSDTPISDVAYISSSGGQRIGDLGPGASAEFTIPSQNFNGSSAADQVYGFGGFDGSNAQQRRISIRRQVIDGLVGFGGFDGGGFSIDGRGPYVIGWRDEAGPMPITVEGLNAQTYLSSVEVLSVRTSLGTGQVTVGPQNMLIDIVSTEGDANQGGPGMILLGEGSVVYSIALPLEAADMAPTKVEILVGPDPSFVLSEPGGFAGFWPAGFTVELMDPTSGEWSMLGDLSERSRFDIDDPSSALSDTGRIMIRITGVPTNPEFGQQGVFASAEVSGVIDE